MCLLKIEGMTCGYCVASINNALKSLDGVQVEHASMFGAFLSPSWRAP